MAAILTGLAAVGSGCSLGFEEGYSSDSSQNQCEEGDSCGTGFCRSGICQTGKAALGPLFLKVVPPAGTPYIAGVSFTQSITDFERGADGPRVTLGKVSQIRGIVTGDPITSKNCVQDPAISEGLAPEDGSLPVRLTLIPRARTLGVLNPSHTVEVNGDGGPNTLLVNVPPGSYDVYVEPLQTSGGCVRPPYLVLDRTVQSGTVNLNVQLPPPEALKVRVIYPGASNDLEGWQIDIVERQTGRLLSNRATLTEGVSTDSGWEYSTQVAFSQVEGDDAAPATELVRLRPPADVVGPTLYVERSVVDLFQGGEGVIDQLSDLASSVTFKGRVATDNARVPVDASVRLLATSLETTGVGTVAAFSRTVQTDQDGLFEAELLPGTYRVIAEPVDESLSAQEISIVVTDAATQAGKTLEVLPRAQLSGSLADFFGDAVTGFPVEAKTVGLETTTNVLELARGLQRIVPRATTSLSESDGRFRLSAEPGSYYVVAQPQASSGYAWRLLFDVDVADQSVDLGKIRLPLPVAVTGSLYAEDLGDLVPDALIVAYAYLKNGEPTDDPTVADQVVPVAETRSDETGIFRLLLPSSFK